MKTIVLALLIVSSEQLSKSNQRECLLDGIRLFEQIITHSIYKNYEGAYYVQESSNGNFNVMFIMSPLVFKRLRPKFKQNIDDITIYFELDNYIFSQNPDTLSYNEIDSIAGSLGVLGMSASSVYLDFHCVNGYLTISAVKLGSLDFSTSIEETILNEYSLEKEFSIKE